MEFGEWIVPRPSVAIANQPRGLAVRREIPELMDAVWIRLPTL